MYGPAPQHCRLVKARLHTHTDTYAYGYGASVDSIFNSGLDARTARDTGRVDSRIEIQRIRILILIIRNS